MAKAVLALLAVVATACIAGGYFYVHPTALPSFSGGYLSYSISVGPVSQLPCAQGLSLTDQPHLLQELQGSPV